MIFYVYVALMTFYSTSFYKSYVDTDSKKIMRLLHWYEFQTPDIKLGRHILSRLAAEIRVWAA